MPPRPPAALPVFLVGVLGIAAAAILVRLALPSPPIVTGFYRMLFATLAVGLFLLGARRAPGLPRREALTALAAGACFGTDLALWNTSLTRTSVATSTLLVNTTPVWVGLHAALVLRERLEGRFLAGAGLGLLGAALLIGRPSHERETLEGALLALGAALFYSGYLLLMKSVRRRGDALPAVFTAGAGATAALGLYALLRGDPLAGFPASAWLAIAALAAISQIGGVLGIVWALRYLPATVAAVALLGQPVGTAALGWLVLGEALAPLQVLGGAAVLLGILLASRAAPATRVGEGPVVPSAAP